MKTKMVTQLLEDLYAASDRRYSEDFLQDCLREIEREYVAPQVLSVLSARQGSCSVSEGFITQVRALHQKTVGQNLYVRFHQQQVLSTLEEYRIPCIPLKGVVFATRYFGHFAARPTSDIDILLTRDKLDSAVECLRSIGFHGPAEYNPLHFHCVMSKTIFPGSDVLNIELHWSLLHENNALPHWNDFWQNAQPLDGYEYIKELSVQDTFYAICLHGANHSLSALKYLIDVAHLIYTRGQEIDFLSLLRTSRRDGTLRRVKAVLSIVYSEFPSLHHWKSLPYRRRSRLMSEAVLKVPVLTPDSWGLRFRIVKEWFWPMREVALWHLREDQGLTSTNVYRRFYRQRVLNLIQVLRTTSPRNRRPKERELHA